MPSDSFTVSLHHRVSGEERVSLLDPRYLPRRHGEAAARAKTGGSRLRGPGQGPIALTLRGPGTAWVGAGPWEGGPRLAGRRVRTLGFRLGPGDNVSPLKCTRVTSGRPPGRRLGSPWPGRLGGRPVGLQGLEEPTVILSFRGLPRRRCRAGQRPASRGSPRSGGAVTPQRVSDPGPGPAGRRSLTWPRSVSVKLDPPCDLQSNVTSHHCVLSWSVRPALEPLSAILSYELAFKKQEEAWEVRLGRPLWGCLSCSRSAGRGAYRAGRRRPGLVGRRRAQSRERDCAHVCLCVSVHTVRTCACARAA